MLDFVVSCNDWSVPISVFPWRLLLSRPRRWVAWPTALLEGREWVKGLLGR